MGHVLAKKVVQKRRERSNALSYSAKHILPFFTFKLGIIFCRERRHAFFRRHLERESREVWWLSLSLCLSLLAFREKNQNKNKFSLFLFRAWFDVSDSDNKIDLSLPWVYICLSVLFNFWQELWKWKVAVGTQKKTFTSLIWLISQSLEKSIPKFWVLGIKKWSFQPVVLIKPVVNLFQFNFDLA